MKSDTNYEIIFRVKIIKLVVACGKNGGFLISLVFDTTSFTSWHCVEDLIVS